jgi:23S rRNA pseudouridine1911/1915/1917 synthase
MASKGGEPPAQGTANAYKRFTYVVEIEQAGQRLDRVVAALHPGLTRTAAEQLILDGQVLLNGRAAKPSSRVSLGANIAVSVPPPPASEAQPEDIPLDVVYEDHTLVVVNKPAGMVVHPAPGNERGTLVNALLGRYASLPGDPMRPGIVHRLDKDTSGLIVVARDPAAVAALAGAFKRREVHKEYLALLVGTMRPPDGSIRGAIGRDPRLRQRMAVVATGGREARTTYRTEEVFRGYSLVRVVLETGRMHQIRVHFTAAGHPVAGDPVYGRAVRGLGLRRQFLHAARLRFRHPATGEELDLEAPLPVDLQRVLDTLRGAGGNAAQG